MIDLQKIEKKVDAVLANETAESLQEFLNKHRNNMNEAKEKIATTPLDSMTDTQKKRTLLYKDALEDLFLILQYSANLHPTKFIRKHRLNAYFFHVLQEEKIVEVSGRGEEAKMKWDSIEPNLAMAIKLLEKIKDYTKKALEKNKEKKKAKEADSEDNTTSDTKTKPIPSENDSDSNSHASNYHPGSLLSYSIPLTLKPETLGKDLHKQLTNINYGILFKDDPENFEVKIIDLINTLDSCLLERSLKFQQDERIWKTKEERFNSRIKHLEDLMKQSSDQKVQLQETNTTLTNKISRLERKITDKEKDHADTLRNHSEEIQALESEKDELQETIRIQKQELDIRSSSIMKLETPHLDYIEKYSLDITNSSLTPQIKRSITKFKNNLEEFENLDPTYSDEAKQLQIQWHDKLTEQSQYLLSELEKHFDTTTSADEKICEGCDKPLKGKQTKWCSDGCRQRAAHDAYRSNHKKQEPKKSKSSFSFLWGLIQFEKHT